MSKPTLILFLLIFCLSATSHAQELNFGIKAGANFSNYTGNVQQFTAENITNFHAGAHAEFRFSKISLQPELMYSTQGARLFDDVQQFENRLGYLAIPVMVRIYLIPNFLSLDVGPQASFLLNEAQNINIEDSNTFDFAVSGGATVHFLGSLFFQGRYNLGLTDVKPNAQVQNTVLQFSAGLRF